MRRYETIVIVQFDLSEEDQGALFDRINELIHSTGGFLAMFDDWGVKKLAYEIRKQLRGHYVRLDYCGTGELVEEIERLFRIDDRILKYMTVLLEKDVDVEALKNEIVEAKEKEKEAKLAAENPPAKAAPAIATPAKAAPAETTPAKAAPAKAAPAKAAPAETTPEKEETPSETPEPEAVTEEPSETTSKEEE